MCKQTAPIYRGCFCREELAFGAPSQYNVPTKMATTQIIGLSGTNGSGKDTVGRLLAQKHNYFFISVTDLLREELKLRGKTTERHNMRDLSAEWRRTYGLAVLVDRALKTYNELPQKYEGLVMASLRNPFEADRVHELGGTVVWVDADPEVRYQRVRNNNRGRTDDDKTFEQFLAEEQAEMHASGDAATLDMSAVKQRADVVIVNDTPSLETLEQAIEDALHVA